MSNGPRPKQVSCWPSIWYTVCERPNVEFDHGRRRAFRQADTCLVFPIGACVIYCHLGIYVSMKMIHSLLPLFASVAMCMHLSPKSFVPVKPHDACRGVSGQLVRYLGVFARSCSGVGFVYFFVSFEFFEIVCAKLYCTLQRFMFLSADLCVFSVLLQELALGNNEIMEDYFPASFFPVLKCYFDDVFIAGGGPGAAGLPSGAITYPCKST